MHHHQLADLLEGSPEGTWSDQADWLRQNRSQALIEDSYVRVSRALRKVRAAGDDEAKDDALCDDLDVLWHALIDHDAAEKQLYRVELVGDWNQVFPATTTLVNEVLAAYDEPHRRYHGIQHIGWGLMQMERYFGKPSKELFLAWVMHDAVYDPQGAANEAKSALWAGKLARKLGLDPRRVDQLIMATKHLTSPDQDDVDMCRLIDIDLLSMGLAAEQFDKNTLEIREEYAWVPDLTFWSGRARILQQFLDREFLYSTPELKGSAWETRAKANLARGVRLAKERAEQIRRALVGSYTSSGAPPDAGSTPE